MRKLFLVGLAGCFLAVSGLNSQTPPVVKQPDGREVAAQVAKTRVKIAEVDLEGFTREHDLLRAKLDMASRLRSNRAMSCDDHLEISRTYNKARTDMLRAAARLEEAKALLKYAEATGQVDTSLTIR